MYGVIWETICPEMLFSLAITLFDVAPPDKFNSFTSLIFNDVTLKHSIFVFIWRLGAERLVEPSLVSLLRSLLPVARATSGKRYGDVTAHGRVQVWPSRNRVATGLRGARTAAESTGTRNHNNPGSGTLPGAVLTIDLPQGGKAKEQTLTSKGQRGTTQSARKLKIFRIVCSRFVHCTLSFFLNY